MNVGYTGLFGAALIALVLTVTAVFFLGKRGPWGSVWTFFLVLFLTLWTISIYVAPIGPRYWGIAWIPIGIAGVILTVLLISAMPHPRDATDQEVSVVPDAKHELPYRPVGKFFWVLIILLVIAIFIGMLNPQKAM